MPYNRNSRYNTRRASFNTGSSSSPFCSEAQHGFITSLVARIEAAQEHASPELLTIAETVIGSISILPNLLSDTEWSKVPKGEVSTVIDTLKGLAAMFDAAAAPAVAAQRASKYAGLPSGFTEMKEPTLFDGKCRKCGGKTTKGVDIAAKYSTGWQAWCLSCATTDPAAADAAAAAAVEARKALAGLHLYNRVVYRIEADGKVLVRRGRRFLPLRGEVPSFSEATRITAEVASVYGSEHGACCNCGEQIGAGADRRSIAVGYGPVCAKRWGWYFPTHDEAEAILARRRVAALANLS